MNPYRAHSIRFLAYGSGIFATALALWVDRTFGSPSIDQILYHMHYADAAAVQMSEVFVVTFLVEVVGVSLVLAALATAVHSRLASGLRGWLASAMRAAPHVAVAGGLAVLLMQGSVFSYAAAHFEEDRFGKSYRDPTTATLTEVQRRNLVLIYVESLEETYADATLFGSDLLAPLRTIGGHSLQAYHQAAGASWTIAAIVATQCGVPLAVASNNNARSDGGKRTFLAGATCLGDILQARGYRNVFLGGASLSFAGKGPFLRDHGYQEAYGREEWLSHGARPTGAAKPEMSSWGLFDDALLVQAREQLAALHAAGQPFNLTLLTLDTHNPNGYPSRTCTGGVPPDQDVPFERIVACSSRQLAEFVRFARVNGYLENTTLVILGDHLAYGNPLDSKLRSVEDRRIFNLFVGTEPFPGRAWPVVAFDMFPTLLEATGMRAEDGRLGLGRSAWAAEGAPIEWVQHPNLPALAGSSSYQRLWKNASSVGG